MFAARADWTLAPNRFTGAVRDRRRNRLPILDLTESNPTRCGFVYDAEKILSALSDARSLTYEPDPRGLLSARHAVIGYYEECGVKLDPDQIFLTASTSEAYSHVFRLLANPGDNVLVPRPSYPLLDFLGRLNDVELVPYPLRYDRGWHIDLKAIQSKIDPRTRMILAVHPNNPTGSYLEKKESQFILRSCQEKGVALVADEVFADYDLARDERRATSFAGTTDALTFTLSGLSKISALPQLKLAWMVVSGPLDQLQGALERLDLIADTYLSVSAPVQHALPALLETRRTLQPQILERVSGNLKWLDEQLSADTPLSRLRSEGGWYAILKLPTIQTDEEWAVELVRREGVIAHPGHFYDFEEEAHLIVSLLPPPEVFAKGVAKILAHVCEHV